MPILTATNIRHSYGDDIILDGLSLTVEPGERIGVVGRNGCGKSTMIKILAGLLRQDLGTVVLLRGERVGYLKQDPEFDENETLREAAEHGFAELHRLHHELHEVYEKMGSAEGAVLEKLLKEQERLDEAIESAGGYAIDHKIDSVLHGLGFTDADFTIPVSGLSGGQKARLALAQLLLEEPGVLLLDEPTNHLDLDGCLWLEAFLRDDYRGAVVMISHDRAMLDGVVKRIIEVEQGRLIDYPGNYRAFRNLRAERRLVMNKAWEAQQAQFKKEEAYIRQYKAGQRAKQAKGRESRLDRAKTGALERPVELAELRLSLPKAERTGDLVVVARGMSKSYPDDEGGIKVLFEDLDLTISRGERWGIVGPNGAGKTTLVRCLLSEQDADAGTVSLGAKVDIGYFRQIHEGLRMDLQVYKFIQDRVKKETDDRVSISEQEARNLAGAFLFSGDEQDKEIELLSGGERSRAVMAGLLASAKNVLVLDEPTNHLDISAAERLEEALAAPREDAKTGEKTGGTFDGTVILISHDRALIDATCDHLLILDGKGGAITFLGTWSEWAAKKGGGNAVRIGVEKKPKKGAAAPPAEPPIGFATAATARAADHKNHTHGKKGGEKKAPKNQSGKATTEKRKKTAFSWMRIEQIEEKMKVFAERVAEIDKELADPQVWVDHEKANGLTDKRDAIKSELAELEAEWLRKAE
ncbi:MAG: ATP-binding cassette subfamily F protein 3 [Phycisphaerales bacterium]|jgi:ATP-binding cassette subfamily F protein 3